LTPFTSLDLSDLPLLRIALFRESASKNSISSSISLPKESLSNTFTKEEIIDLEIDDVTSTGFFDILLLFDTGDDSLFFGLVVPKYVFSWRVFTWQVSDNSRTIEGSGCESDSLAKQTAKCLPFTLQAG